MTINQKPFLRKAMTSLLRIQEEAETRDRFNPLPLDESTFRQYVADKDDLKGMIAYCFYKFQKIKFLERNPLASEVEVARACKRFVSARSYAENLGKAQSKLDALEQETLEVFLSRKTKRDVYIGVISGIIAAVLAPLVFSLLQRAIMLSGVAAAL